MNAKDLLKNKSICTLPWTGFELEPSGTVKNCIISKTKLGTINKSNIKDIMDGFKVVVCKQQTPELCWLLPTREKHNQPEQYQ